MYENDPLWKLRHALIGVGLATLLSVPVAAMLGSAIGDAIGQSYEWRAGMYTALVIYVIAGAIVLFAKVARHETQPVSARRVGLWLLSLWLWPALLLARRGAAPEGPGSGPSSGP